MAAASFVNVTTSSDTGTFNVTANAGTNRVLIVWTWDIVDTVTGVTWGGDALTELDNETYDSPDQRVWIRAIGTSGTNQTQSLVVSSTSANNLRVAALVYENVNQTTPAQSQDLSSSEGSTVSSRTGNNMAYTGSTALVSAYCYAPAGSPAVTNSGFTSRASFTNIAIGDYTDSNGTPAAVTVTGTITANLTTGGVVFADQLNAAVAPAVIAATTSVPSPTVTGTANVTVSSPVTIATSVQAPTVSAGTAKWLNTDKSTAPSWVNTDKS